MINNQTIGVVASHFGNRTVQLLLVFGVQVLLKGLLDDVVNEIQLVLFEQQLVDFDDLLVLNRQLNDVYFAFGLLKNVGVIVFAEDQISFATNEFFTEAY